MLDQSNPQEPARAHDLVTIIVNGRPRQYGEKRISYEQLVEIAFPGSHPEPGVNYTVTYSIPHGKDGTLVAGQSVEVKDGIVFNVAKTYRS